MKMCGVPSNALRPNTVCHVQVWQSAVGLTQQRLTKANAGPKKGNHDGRPPTVFPRFCRPQGQKSKILLSSSIRLTSGVTRFHRFLHPKNRSGTPIAVFIGHDRFFGLE